MRHNCIYDIILTPITPLLVILSEYNERENLFLTSITLSEALSYGLPSRSSPRNDDQNRAPNNDTYKY